MVSIPFLRPNEIENQLRLRGLSNQQIQAIVDRIQANQTQQDQNTQTVAPANAGVDVQALNVGNIENPQLPAGTEFQPTPQQMQQEETLLGQELGDDPTVQAQQAQQQQQPDAAQVDPQQIGGAVDQALVDAATGEVSQDAQVAAQTSTNIPQISAEQIAAGQTVEAAQIEGDFGVDAAVGELSDDARVVAAQAQASEEFNEAISSLQQEINQTPVDPRATVREQYSQLMDFEAGETPAWAAGALRSAQQLMAARGITGSTIAGEAVTSALMQAALPIAQQDARVFETWNLEVLDKKAQVGILRASHIATLDVQNAQFRQQAAVENARSSLQIDLANLDNEQQARVLNAQQALQQATQNAGFRQQASIETARNFLQMDVANLDAATRTAIQNAQAALTIETQNLNNRQQAAVENARAFLNMDLTNVANAQQAAIVNSQTRLQAMLSDQAAVNAAQQFNAESENQVNQFFAGLSADISKFNAAQTLDAQQFNAAMADAREQFDVRNAILIEQGNIQYLRQLNTANTAAENEAALFNAQNLLGISNTAMANALTLLRDENARIFESSENGKERGLRLAIAELDADTRLSLLNKELRNRSGNALGGFISGIIGDILPAVIDLF